MKKFYIGYTILYIVMFAFEFYSYLKFDSNLFGLIYVILNLAILLFIIFTSLNYRPKNVRLRISKNFFLLFIILFNLLILPKLSYIDESYEFIESIRMYVYMYKGAFVISLLAITYFEFKVRIRVKYKVKQPSQTLL